MSPEEIKDIAVAEETVVIWVVGLTSGLLDGKYGGISGFVEMLSVEDLWSMAQDSLLRRSLR